MKDEATPEQLAMAMARRIANDRCPGQGQSLLWEASFYAALAAIIKTTELAAKLAERHYESAGCHAMYKNAGHQFAQAFRAGDHLKGQDHG